MSVLCAGRRLKNEGWGQSGDERIEAGSHQMVNSDRILTNLLVIYQLVPAPKGAESFCSCYPTVTVWSCGAHQGWSPLRIPQAICASKCCSSLSPDRSMIVPSQKWSRLHDIYLQRSVRLWIYNDAPQWSVISTGAWSWYSCLLWQYCDDNVNLGEN